jgi:ADP-ribosylglycohydrolase
MRVAPVGWLALSEEDARKTAGTQAAISHNNRDAIAGAQAVALAIFFARSKLPCSDIRSRIEREFHYDLSPERALRPSDLSRGFGHEQILAAKTVPQALAAAIDAHNWVEAVRTAVGLGGDTDTVACMAGAVAQAIHGLPDDIADRARGYLTEDLLEVLRRFEQAVGPQED